LGQLRYTGINSTHQENTDFTAKNQHKDMVINSRQQVKFVTLNQRVVGSSPTWRIELRTVGRLSGYVGVAADPVLGGQPLAQKMKCNLFRNGISSGVLR